MIQEVSQKKVGGIPQELQALDQWAVIRTAPDPKRPGHYNKMPLRAENLRLPAKSNDPATWSFYERAADAASGHNDLYVTFALSTDDAYFVIDLDDAVIDGKPTAAAMQIMMRFGTYAEYSLSGRGIHIFGKGKLPGAGKKNETIEIYDQGRFIAMTGKVLPAYKVIKDCGEEVIKFYNEHFPPRPYTPTTEPAEVSPAYARKALIDECCKVASAAAGSRNDFLNRAAFSLSRFTPELLSEDEIRTSLLSAAESSGLSEREARGTIQSGLSRGQIKHMDKPQLKTDKRGGGIMPLADDIYNLSDAGNAQRFAEQHGGKLRYCYTTGTWLYYDGKRWDPAKGEEASRRLAVLTARSIRDDVDKFSYLPDKEKERILRFSLLSEKHQNLSAMISEAKAVSPIPIYGDQLDQNPMLFNAKNKTIDLQTGEILAHNPDHLITKMGDVLYDDTADCPLWKQCLNVWMAGDKEKIDYLQRLAGYCLTGDISSRTFPLFYGSGKNGKSVFCNTILSIMSDYATVAPNSLLREAFQEGHPTEIASLYGRRLVLASETKSNMRLRVDLVKSMTGETILKGRYMRQDYFDFVITHKIILMTNTLPVVDDSSDAIWDRVHLVEWPVRIEPDKQDLTLLDKLKKEKSGILNWMLEGCRTWVEDHDLRPPKSIRERTEQYRQDSDPFREYFDDCCLGIPGNEELFIPKSDLRKSYEKWCESNRQKPLSLKAMNEYLRRNGYKDGPKRIDGKVCKCWHGLSLQENFPVFEDL